MMLSTPSAKNDHPIGMLSIAHVIENTASSPYHKAQYLSYGYLLNCFTGNTNHEIGATRIRTFFSLLDVKVKYWLISARIAKRKIVLYITLQIQKVV